MTIEIVTDSNVSDANVTVSSYAGNPTNSSLPSPPLGRFIDINASDDLADRINWSIVRVYYSDEEVSASKLNESTLGLYWFDDSLFGWQRLDAGSMDWVYATGLDMTENFVWANVTHFGVFAVGGESLSSSVVIPLSSGWNLLSCPLG